MHPLLTKLQQIIATARAQGQSHAQIRALISALLYSDALALAVASTPTPIDDLVVGALKLLFPPVAPPTLAA
ncbi:hypothetical protein R5W24_004430 [Gemmata sp. JC717]|uniref:hypothetical protein n=1 Tax=Gemmata algarum TaxID=2975278 RepID=UPI0021BBB24C|nr:hypothetical protein [Gemmata algarum]MDY3555289.1 hypothetical protein [Gemmata algarum]